MLTLVIGASLSEPHTGGSCSTVVRWLRSQNFMQQTWKAIQPWYDGRIFKCLRNKHGKLHTVGSLFNCGTVVAFPKVNVCFV